MPTLIYDPGKSIDLLAADQLAAYVVERIAKRQAEIVDDALTDYLFNGSIGASDETLLLLGIERPTGKPWGLFSE